MNVDDIRDTFVRFMVERGHTPLPSASLVPHGDPTLLFTSAGMVPFKPYFMGLAEPPAKRIVTVQKVFRTTDIEGVGDYSHLTMFEMLGNFSFGDYFKREAIRWAWDLLTDGFGLDGGSLWASIYLDDDEAHDLWREIGLPETRIHRYDRDYNYWPPGDWDGIGPCGPNSEVFVDRGPRETCDYCRNGACKPNLEPDCGRFLEVWNLVFMTLYQNEHGERTPLPKRNIDTGSGLERVACILQNRDSVYETDVFRPVLDRISALVSMPYGEDERLDRAMRIVAEHVRAATFLITDGVTPSNEGRGYVLRRILRRAIYFLTQLTKSNEPLLDKVADVVITRMERAYPDVRERAAFTTRLLATEETKFRETLERGRSHLEGVLAAAANERVVSGRDAFTLYDTYGFPFDLTREIAASRGFTTDANGFEREMEAQRERGRAAAKFEFEAARISAYTELAHLRTTFIGYDRTTHRTAIAGIVGAAGVQGSAEEREEVEIALAETPFYPEGGGQVGDAGEIFAPQGRVVVDDTRYASEGLIVHRGRVASGRISVDDAVEATVSPASRRASQRNHTATHLLHAALREVLGTHVKQAGSLVTPDRLRFDFTHIEAMKPEELAAVQRLVNEKIRADIEVHWEIQPYEQAIAGGAMALFGEKYTADVRVVGICEPNGPQHEARCFSKELCGGTHCSRTGEIGAFVIVSEGSVGSGVRRIEALTGALADEYVIAQQARLAAISRRLNTAPEDLETRVDALEAELSEARRRIEQLQRQAGKAEVEQIIDTAERIDGASLVVARVPAANADAMREMGDLLRERLGSAVIVLGAVMDNRPSFLVMSTKDVSGRVHAGNLIKQIAPIAGGGGGGPKEMAQGGGKDPSKLDEALAAARRIAREQLASA
jgi:alanyl-tRNA synthetase